MDTVICKELIVATLTRRGKGEKHSPVRIITQIFEKDGTLVAEHDPSPETFSIMDLVNFTKWCIDKDFQVQNVTPEDVNKWLDWISK